MRALALLVAVAVAAFAPLGAGCAVLIGPTAVHPDPRPEAPELADVPVPESFQIKRSRSGVYVREVRIATLVYETTVHIDAAADALRERLGPMRWKAIRDDRPSGSRRVLWFEKGHESLEVTLKRDFGFTEAVIEVIPKDETFVRRDRE